MKGSELKSGVRPNEKDEAEEGRCWLGEVEGDEGTIEADEEEPDKGMRMTAQMNDPKDPSEQERREHEMSHLPFRSWCRHCVRGRGKEAAHKKQSDHEGSLPEVHFDFAFMGDEADPGNTVAMHVARVRDSRMTLATAVPSKSTGSLWWTGCWHS